MRITDREQVELLQDWWKNYGKILTIAIIIGLAFGFGWRYFRQYQTAQNQEASMMYQAMIMADSENNFQKTQQFASQIQQKHAKTAYASMANLILAREAIAKNNFQQAFEYLNWVLQNSKLPTLKQIARLRAARVLIAMNRSSAALALLATVDDEMYKPVIDHVKADAYAALGNHPEALAAYHSAQKSFLTAGLEDPLVNMKLAGS